jgi:prephenate dehydrogenase
VIDSIKSDLPNLLVIGLGLIGASFAKGLKQQNAAYIVGFDAHTESMHTAIELGVIDEAAVDLANAVENADIIQIAVPVLAVESVLSSIARYLSADCVLTDVGSVKASFLDACHKIIPNHAAIVPAHPIAGAEKSGVTAVNPSLFQQHQVIITPLATASEYQNTLVKDLWQTLGAEVVFMDSGHHDEVLAATSHLPHLLAFSLVDTLNEQSDNRDIFNYAAGGFRDFTRIAASDPTMWSDICLANDKALLTVLDDFTADLTKLRAAIESKDSALLKKTFQSAKEARDHFSNILELRQNK